MDTEHIIAIIKRRENAIREMCTVIEDALDKHDYYKATRVAMSLQSCACNLLIFSLRGPQIIGKHTTYFPQKQEMEDIVQSIGLED